MKQLYLLILSIFIFSCKPTNKDIIKVEFKSICGSKGCKSHRSVFTKDSIIESYFNWNPEAFKETKRTNTPENWEKLLKNVDIEAFKNIKSDSGRYQYDGTDEIIILHFSNQKRLKVSNGDQDSLYYPRIEKLYQFYRNQ
ncbi:hypothetical protein [Epilithonimonas arachidiradicis]|uniref:Lipoprotein n=1 Tax=Epilithonimonas arachidiradicis TaxID=1617282 RepID=A0A420CXQ4_9FLAO|nr:hypothetical protein [Epilithonimonas arachidiradicis]RKE83251.1 hypothetical protein BXY58_2806 [Epilithonimonas arachidiradicis]GGG65974.1 hypothetical protein GCM10007332_30760 [Epilithonimonas arachidiradicis]